LSVLLAVQKHQTIENDSRTRIQVPVYSQSILDGRPALVGRRLLVSLTHVGQQAVEIAAPNAIAISRVTLAPLDPREREALIPLLAKLHGIASPPVDRRHGGTKRGNLDYPIQTGGGNQQEVLP
jgi:hypothetical protein